MENFSGNKKNPGETSSDNLVNNVDSAVDSFDRVKFENNLGYIQANLERIDTRTDWTKASTAIEKAQLSDDQRAAAESTIRVIQSLMAVQNKEEVMKRAARNITDIATAAELFESKMGSDMPDGITTATHYLFEAAGAFASPEEVKKAAFIKGGGEGGALMSEEELREARERVSKTNIS